MTQTSCPKCEKPIRPGAKFCGHCGETVSSAAAGAQQQAPPNGSPCPHCSKPVRKGAKFCSHCGNGIDQESASPIPPIGAPPPPPSHQAVPSPEPSAEQLAPTQASAGAQPAVPPTKPGGAAAPTTPRTPPPAVPPPPAVVPPARKSRILPVVVILAVVLCAALVVGGFFFRDQITAMFGPQGITTSPTTIAIAATDTELPPEPTTIDPTNTLSPTDTVPPEETATPEETPPTINSPEATSTQGEGPPQPPNGYLLEETFDGIIATNWNPWGVPRPNIERGFIDKFLNLVAQNSTSSGISSKADFPIIPGLEIHFAARQIPTLSQYKMYFDLDRAQISREANGNEVGLLQLEIQKDKMTWMASNTDEPCEALSDGTKVHNYRIVVLEGSGIALYLDNNLEPVCEFPNLGLDPLSGRLSFRGMGSLSSVYVLAP